MKQSEKLDKILQVLYPERYSGNRYKIYSVMDNAGLDVSDIESYSLAKRLSDDGYVNGVFHKDGGEIGITSLGIDYCEATSYSNPSEPAINLTIINSPGASISTGNNITGNVNNSSELVQLVQNIKMELQKSNSDQNLIIEIGKCLDEIMEEVKKGRTINKFTLKGLLGSTADITTVYPKVEEFIRLLNII